MFLNLQTRLTPSASIQRVSSDGWRLSLSPGDHKEYRWAQLDDYLHIARNRFSWKAPVQLSVHARVSAPDLPGTWGFGFWNDPLNFSLGLNGMARRLPALPNTAWFFYASPPNFLAFNDLHPANGFLTAVFSSPQIPSLFFAPAVPLLPLAVFKPAARLLRRLASRIIREDAKQIETDVTQWHFYRLEWLPQSVSFFMDNLLLYQTDIAPRGKLGFVLWIDNQYAALTAQGIFSAGKLAYSETSWMEIKHLDIQPITAI